jgi:hypothetical protein
VRDGDDRHTGGKEDPRVRLRPSMLKHDRDGNKDEKPIDRHGNFSMDCVIKIKSAEVIL